MKIYAIYSGCGFEGGGVKEIYADKEKAIKFALMVLESEKQSVNELWEDEEMEWKEICDRTYLHDSRNKNVAKPR